MWGWEEGGLPATRRLNMFWPLEESACSSAADVHAASMLMSAPAMKFPGVRRHAQRGERHAQPQRAAVMGFLSPRICVPQPSHFHVNLPLDTCSRCKDTLSA